MTTRITTVSVTPSTTSVSGTYTVADVVQDSNGKWQESDHIVQAIAPTAEGFTLSHDGQIYNFVADQDLRDRVDAILEDHFSKPRTAKSVTPRPTTKNPKPKTYWLAYADEVTPITCTIGSWVVRPGLRWYDKAADPHQVWLINRRTGTLSFSPSAKVKFA